MATLYILYSKSINRYYVGSCLDLDTRLNDHLTGKHNFAFTKKAADWEVYFQIDQLKYEDARKLEKYVKSMKSRKYIESLKAYSELKNKLISMTSQAGSSR
jgi:putative endonuclease